MPLLLALGVLPSLAAPAPAQPAADAVAVVKKVYAASEARKARVYSKRLQALLDKEARQARGEVGNLDFDFAVNGQDTETGYRKTLRYETASESGNKAVVKVRFRNFEPQLLEYDLVRESGGWVVDEVRSLGKTKWVLSSVLRGGR